MGPEDLSHPQPYVRAGRQVAPAKALVFDSKGTRLFHAGHDKSIWVARPPYWEPDQRFHLPGWHGFDGSIYDIAISPDDRWLAAGGCQGCSGRWPPNDTYVIYVLDADTGEIVGTADLPGTTRDLAFSPDGKWLAAADAARAISVWRVDARGRLSSSAVEPGHGRMINDIVWSPDASGFYSAADDGLLVRWSQHEVGGWYPEWHAAHDVALTSIEVNKKGDELFVGTYDGRIEAAQAEDGKFVETLHERPTGHVFALKRSKNGLRLVYGSGGGTGNAGWVNAGVGSIDIGDGNGAHFAKSVDSVLALAWTGEDDDPIAALPATGEIRFHKAKRHHYISAGPRAGAPIGWVKTKGDALAFGENDEETKVVTFDLAELDRREMDEVDGYTAGDGSIYRSVQVNNPRAGVVRAERHGTRRVDFYGIGDIYINAWAVFERDVFAMSLGWVLTMVDFSDPSRVDCQGHRGRISSVAWMRGGELLVSASTDRTIRIWNSKTCELLMTLFDDGHSEWVAWTPDARYAHSANGADLLGFRVNQGVRKPPLLKTTADYPDLHQPEHLLEILRAGTAGLPTLEREEP